MEMKKIQKISQAIVDIAIIVLLTHSGRIGDSKEADKQSGCYHSELHLSLGIYQLRDLKI